MSNNPPELPPKLILKNYRKSEFFHLLGERGLSVCYNTFITRVRLSAGIATDDKDFANRLDFKISEIKAYLEDWGLPGEEWEG